MSFTSWANQRGKVLWFVVLDMTGEGRCMMGVDHTLRLQIGGWVSDHREYQTHGS